LYVLNSIRSFISLNIDSSLISRLKLIQDDIRIMLKDHKVKWENPDKFHMTLRFLGDIEESNITEISAELGSVMLGFDNIRMTASGIGFFPNQKRPNVVFIDLTEEGNFSEQLVNEIDNKLNRFGFKPDKKFVPHVTVGRFRRENRKGLHEQINVNVEPIEIIFDSFYLMKSVLKPGGSVYEVLQEYKFITNRFPLSPKVKRE